jgi:VWFA-related protein
VVVDVVAREKNGPAKGLTRGEFTLLDNGKPQPIAFFSMTEARSSQAAAAPLSASNRATGGAEAPASATVLVIDRLNTPANYQVYANQKVLEFLKARANRAPLGIYVLGSSVRVVQDLTDDQERLSRAVQSLKPQDVKRLSDDLTIATTGDAVRDRMSADSLTGLQDIVVTDRVETTREALEAIARHLAKVPGRKNLIWVSGSFPLFIQRAHYNIDFSGDVDEAARVLNDANVAVYPVDARGLMGAASGTADQQGDASIKNCATQKGPCILPGPGAGNLPSGVDTMNFLANLTGGRSFYNSNGIEDSIRKAIEDAQVTYTLGFYPAAGSMDETFHKLAVKVARKGVEVRLRNGYFASKNAQQAAPVSIKQLLSDSLDATAVGLSVQASLEKPGRYGLKITLDLHDIHLERVDTKWVGNVDLAFLIEGTQSGKAVTNRIEIPEARLASALEKGMVVTDSIEAAGQTARLRVVVQDRATGAAGSVRVALSTR